MKRLLNILLLSLFTLNVFSQEVPKQKLSFDTYLEPFLLDFIEEAEERGVDDAKGLLIQNIDYIITTTAIGLEEGDKRIGATTSDCRTILLSYLLVEVNRDNITKLVLYHEIGHALTCSPDHSCESCTSIMSVSMVDDINVYEDERLWKNMLDEYFEWLKNNLK